MAAIFVSMMLALSAARSEEVLEVLEEGWPGPTAHK
jgi:hypothetical protein